VHDIGRYMVDTWLVCREIRTLSVWDLVRQQVKDEGRAMRK
jgi:hypothetical protein